MVRPDLQKWSLSLSTLTELSISAEHPRTRERLTALVLLSQGQAADGYRGPARCAERLHAVLGRDVHTVLKRVHDFNAGGPAALVYRHTGGTPLRRDRLAPLVREVPEEARTMAALPVLKNAEAPAESASQADEDAAAAPRRAAVRWTMRSLCELACCVIGVRFCCETMRRVVHRLGLTILLP